VNGHDAAEEVCRLVGASSLLEWLELPPTVPSGDARDALRARRRALQAQQGNPKHRAVAKLVITRFRVLDALLVDPAAYHQVVERARTRSQLPLLDMGVDGVLADGTVTEEELAFLHDTARRLGLDPHVALGRLRLRAEARGVSLAPPVPHAPMPSLAGMSHPLLPRGWWGDGVSRWLAAQVPSHARRVVEGRCGEGTAALALLTLRPGLHYLGFDEPTFTASAEAMFEAQGLERATALPCEAHAMPVADHTADVVLFVLHAPDAAELAEARRVVTRGGRIVVVTPGVPRATHDGPVPALDGALWGLCRAALLVPSLPGTRAASTFVVTHTVVGNRSALVALLLSRVAAVQHAARLSDHHPAIRRVAQALDAFGDGPDGVGTYEVPLVARVL